MKLDIMPERYPLYGTFELTLRCNLHCKMCMFRRKDSENECLQKKELNTQQWITMAREVAQAGTLNLLITGGEPMLRKDFCEVYKGIYEQGFLISLYTNATMVTEEIMQTLHRYPPHRIGVTLYGADNASYDKVCADPKGFDKVIEGIKRLRELPSLLEYRMTIIKENVDDVDRICNLVEEYGGYVTNTLTVFKPVRGGCMPVGESRLCAKDAVELSFNRLVDRIERSLPEKMRGRVHVRARENVEGCTSGKDKFSLMGCSAGMESYTVTYDGKLIGCQMLGEFSTDALTNGFKKAWDDYPFTVRLQEDPVDCKKCEYRSLCNVCPAVRIAETGCIDGIPRYICEFSKETKKLRH